MGIKTGLCSYGMSGRIFHAPFIESHPGYELTAIVERTKNESAARYPNAKIVRSIDDLLRDESIELIVVNTPVQTHYEFVRSALQAGKNVIVEKPFTVDATQAKKLEELAKEKELVLSVYQNRRYDGDYYAIKDVVDNNLLGDIVEVEMRFDRYRLHFSGKTHKEGSLHGAGVLHDLGAHLIDQAIQLFGWPEKVFADIRILRGGDVAANDYFEVLLYYPRLRVRIKSTVVARESYYAYILHGLKGSFLQGRSDMQEEKLDKGAVPTIDTWCPGPTKPDGILHTEIDGQVVRKETTSGPGNYMGYYDDVYKCLREGRPNPVPAGDAVKSMRIIDAAVESVATGGWVEVKALVG